LHLQFSTLHLKALSNRIHRCQAAPLHQNSECKQSALEAARESGRATIRCGHHPRISRVPWSIVDSKIMAASRRSISLGVASLRTYYRFLRWKAIRHTEVSALGSRYPVKMFPDSLAPAENRSTAQHKS
jgi:hypothetical protein